MEHLAIINHNSFRSIGFHKSRSPSSPYGPAPQGSQLITLGGGGCDGGGVVVVEVVVIAFVRVAAS